MNSNNDYSIEGFKECAGRFCKNAAKVSLKVHYINKAGLFCEACAANLVQDGLATAVGE